MILGLVAAKDNSSRFLGKNKFIYNGKPLFWHSVEPLLQSNLVDDVYVITDSVDIEKYCHKNNIKTIWRPKNASRNEDKLINILRFGYYNLNVDYNIVVSIMANCPGHNSQDVDKAIKLLKNNKLKEVRSFNDNGEENGILVLNKEIIQNNNDISYYMGNIQTQAKEIHYKEDL
jgi:CMP-N-acetylneuraminic acid synthetase